ncbi:VWD domain-containing protein [Pseudarthrobacter sulfonivorans]|uniref:VWD domain-containing protein n=1 Tax=Pseudarthrobacter sulfonivorans TaxID=121292 RepID=UPI00168A5FD4|nr:VWD domain-containing protein [Pseudarthrobacter sulfonivorans]
MASSSSAAALQVTSLEHDGKPVQPQLASVSFEDGYAQAVAPTLTELAAGGSSTLELKVMRGEEDAHLGLITVTAGDAASTYGTQSRWPIVTPGRYRLTATYQAPWLVNSSTPCAAHTPVTVEFNVKDPNSVEVLPYFIAGLVVLVLVAFILFFLRRRRRQGTTALTLLFVFLFAVSGVTLFGQQPALASIDVHPGVQQRFNDCKSKYQAHGGDEAGVYERTTTADGEVKLRRSFPEGDKPLDLPGSRHYDLPVPGGTVAWDLDPTQPPLTGGVPRDACSELYHELAHADEQLRNKRTDRRICVYDGPNGEVMSNIPMTEVAATRAENQYRASQGLPLRTSYSEDRNGTPLKLPPDGTQCRPRALIDILLGNGGAKCSADLGCSTMYGDPHIRTLDGVYLDVQAVGEFYAARSLAPDPDLAVQVRMAPLPGSRFVSAVTAAAVGVNDNRIGFFLAGGGVSLTVRVNGQTADMSSGHIALAGGGSIDRSADGTYSVTWPDGSTLWMTQQYSVLNLRIGLAASRQGAVNGLLGSFDGNRDNDISTREGTTFMPPVAFGDLYGGFAQSWRINSAESLFDYGAGQDTGTFTDTTFPDRFFSAKDLGDTGSAEQVCRSSGITSDPWLANCILDVGLTGNPRFAISAAEAQVFTISGSLQFVTRSGADRLGSGDGNLAPDGTADAVLTAELKGHIANLVLAVCSEDGTPASHHWDTYAGSAPIPPGFSFGVGSQTWSLGIYSGSTQLNSSDGSMPTLTLNEPRTFELHVQDDGSLAASGRVCLSVFAPDGSSYRIAARF